MWTLTLFNLTFLTKISYMHKNLYKTLKEKKHEGFLKEITIRFFDF